MPLLGSVSKIPYLEAINMYPLKYFRLLRLLTLIYCCMYFVNIVPEF